MQQTILKPSTLLSPQIHWKDRIYFQRVHNTDEITIASIYLKSRLLLDASAALDSRDSIEGFHGVDTSEANVAQLPKKLVAFYGTWKFIIVFTKGHEPRKMARTATLLTFIRDVPGSNPGCSTDYPDLDFKIHQFLLRNSVTMLVHMLFYP
jgi:hypothetical protein